jgi:hypothetical protein
LVSEGKERADGNGELQYHLLTYTLLCRITEPRYSFNQALNEYFPTRATLRSF